MPRVTAKRLLVAWIVAFTALVAFAIGQNRQLGEQGEEAHNALCAFTTNLEKSVAGSRQYLEDVTPGKDKRIKRERIAGITDADIQASIDRQQTTIDSLRTLECPTEGGTP